MIDLRKGECLKELQTIKTDSIDCIITSPPYWKGFEYEAYFNSYLQYINWCEQWLKECKRVLKKNGTFYLNITNDSETTTRAFELLSLATNNVMFKLHETIIWYRYNQQPANTTRQLTNQTEFVFMLRNTSANVYLNKEAAYNYNPKMFKTKNVGNVWEIPFNSGKQNGQSFGRKETKCAYGHSGFPIQIPTTCILLSTKENDTILDCFMGTGTTGVACQNTNRKFIGIDLDDNAFEISQKRIEENKYKLF